MMEIKKTRASELLAEKLAAHGAQTELEARCGIPRNRLGRLMRGEAEPRAAEAVALFRAARIPVSAWAEVVK